MPSKSFTKKIVLLAVVTTTVGVGLKPQCARPGNNGQDFDACYRRQCGSGGYACNKQEKETAIQACSTPRTY